MKRLPLYFLAGALAVTLCACSSQSSTGASGPDPATQSGTPAAQATPDAPPAEPTPSPEPESEALAIGTEAALGDWTITVTGFELTARIEDGYGYFAPDEGSQYGTVSMTITNNGKQSDTFLPSFSMNDDVRTSIFYAEEYEYSSTNLLGYSDDIHNATLNPLTSKDGVIAFELPDMVTDSSEPLTIVFSCGRDTVEYILR